MLRCSVDCDSELSEDAVKYLIEASNIYHEYVFFIPRVMSFTDKKIIQNEGSCVHYLGITVKSENSGKEKDKVSTTYKEIRNFGGGCYLVNLDRAFYIQGYDEAFFYTLEDLDFSIRNYLINNKALLVPEAEIYHKGGTEGLSYREGYEYPSKRLFLFIRNRWFFIIKNYSLKSILLLLPLNFFVECLLLFFSLLRASDKMVYFKSHISLFKNLKNILKKRTNTVDINEFIYNEDLRLNKATFGGPIMRICFICVNRVLLLYGRYIMKLDKAC